MNVIIVINMNVILTILEEFIKIITLTCIISVLDNIHLYNWNMFDMIICKDK